ncbi:MAG: MFS transporter, partial [Acidisphaera sp.]|nr:MFS transporter [Acidisphaera sp.]
RTRYGIVALLFCTGVVNYLDRTNLSIAAPSLSHELGIDAVAMGWLFSAFGWTYTAMQLPGGWLADRVHPRVLYPASIAVWSIATLSVGWVAGLASLVVLRLLVGVFESPTYIMNNRIVTTWFPERERASTVGIYTSAQYVGLGFLLPALAWTGARYGWRSIFVLTGGLGLLIFLAWLLVYRDPIARRGTNEAEIKLIADGGGIPDLSERIHARRGGRPGVVWSDFRAVFSSRKLWGIYLGQYSFNATANFFMTWFPTYLVQYRHMDFIKAGFYGMVPFLAGFCGVLTSGFVSDLLLRRGASLAVARKTPVLTGVLLSTVIVGAQFVQSPAAVIALLTVAFFGTGMASITWSFVSALAPERLIGLTGGVFNFFGGVSAITVPIIIGYLVEGGDFTPALVFVAALSVFAAFCYVVLVGKMERVQA